MHVSKHSMWHDVKFYVETNQGLILSFQLFDVTWAVEHDTFVGVYCMGVVLIYNVYAFACACYNEEKRILLVGS